jgi:hypothetical protein
MNYQLRWTMGISFVVLVALLLAALYYRAPTVDGFENLSNNPFDNGRVPLGGNCGIDARVTTKPWATCEQPYRCVNGYCKSDSPVPLPEITPLPIRPDRYTSDSSI